MSEAQFLAQADTGDILLFRGSMAGAMVTRTFTGSHFDHVAMILKFESSPEEVFLVEATGNLGVSLNRWQNLRPHVGASRFYEKLVFRHIEFDRGDKMVNNLEKFLSEAVGLKYGLGGNKLMRKKTTIKSSVDENELIESDRTFFCSELVAKAFKILGIIEDDDLSCTQFYPHNFSSKGDDMLRLTKGTTITEQLQVIVDPDDLTNSSVIDFLPND